MKNTLKYLKYLRNLGCAMASRIRGVHRPINNLQTSTSLTLLLVLYALTFFLLFRDDEQEFLPCNKINVGVCTSSGNTALHLASQGGFVKVVEQLLNCRHKW